jgi:3-hydroxyacyl-CoA dehydrogenase/enoyl-CoA hydratase/3-hydroxybutyryl-CoA epimerase
MTDAVRSEVDAAGVMTVWLDLPGRSVNTMSAAMWAGLDGVLHAIETTRPKGVVLASAKPRSFVAGADLFEMQAMTDLQLDDYLATGQRILDRLAALPMPTVAAINGDALGGGYELALACRHRIAIDEPRIRIGMPETTLGLVPGWGGTIRLPRLIGLAEALGVMLPGRAVTPAEAAALGMIDALAPRDGLLAAARAVALAPSDHKAAAADRDANPADRARMLTRFREETRARSGDSLPAPLRLIEVVAVSYDQGHRAASAAERLGLVEMRRTEAGRNMMRLFFLKTAAKKAAVARAAGKPRAVRTAVVIGGGTMGAGIAHALHRAGIATQVVEADAAAAAAAADRLVRLVGTDAIHATADWSAVPSADLIVEAVVERLPEKLRVFRRVAGLASPEAVVATNTSSLSVAEIAAATGRPDRVIGLHFFNPVAKMPLVEVVRHPRADADAVATGVAVATAAGKTPVVVGDGPGFIVNRVLFPYLHEAVAMYAEGHPVAAIDAAMRSWGMPLGPFQLLDEIGLDVTAMILDALRHALGDRLAQPPVLGRMVARGWLGRKSGTGFYVHPPDGKPTPNPELIEPAAQPGPAAIAPLDVQRRLMEPMAAEARLVLESGVADSADTIDLATVLGLGFPPFRGGLATFAGLRS